MTPLKTIEFASASEVAENCAVPWASPKLSTYQDLLLKPEYSARRFKFPTGATWFRIVPAMRGSRGWMLDFYALNYQGRHAHPKMIKPGASSVFDRAYQYCKINCPERLYRKANKEGYKLLSDPVCLFWALFEEGGNTVARLVVESGYNGERGGAPGLGHQLWKLTQERDELGDLVANPVDPIGGLQICVEKTLPTGTRFPSYTLRVGRVPAPISDFLDKMAPAEIEALCPLADVVYLPDPEEEWKLLEKVIDPVTVAEIRAAQK